MSRAITLLYGVTALVLRLVNAVSVINIGPNYSVCPANTTVYVQSAYFGNGEYGYITVPGPMSPTMGMTSPTVSTTMSLSTAQGQSRTVTYTSTNSAGTRVRVSVIEPPLQIGQGLPAGTTTDLPDTFIIAFSLMSSGTSRRARHKRESDTFNLYVDGYVAANGTTGQTTPDCVYGDRFILSGGMLESATTGNIVGKNQSDPYALVTGSPYTNQIVSYFSFQNGMLAWNTLDLGPATFYQCGGGPIYAGFPDAPFSNCSTVALGAVQSEQCPVDLSGSAAVQVSATTDSATTVPSTTAMSTSDMSSTTSSSSVDTDASTSSSTTDSSAISTTSSSTTSTATTTSSTSTMTNVIATTSAPSSTCSPSPATVVLWDPLSTQITGHSVLYVCASTTMSTTTTPSTTSLTSTTDTAITTAPSSTCSASTIVLWDPLHTQITGHTVTTICNAITTSVSSLGMYLNTTTSISLNATMSVSTTMSDLGTTGLLNSTTTMSNMTTSATTTAAASTGTAITGNSTTNSPTNTDTNTSGATQTNGFVYSGPSDGNTPIANEAYCPNCDLGVVNDNANGVTYNYQIYCDAAISGDFVGTTMNKVTFSGCLDACNAFSVNSLGPACAGAVYNSSGCYLFDSVTTQSNGWYNYYLAGATAGQVLNSNYPSPTSNKAGPTGTTMSATTSFSTTSSSTTSSSTTSISTTAGPYQYAQTANGHAPIAHDAFCPAYDGLVVDNTYNGVYLNYQIYCDAAMDGALIGTQTGKDMDLCLNYCNSYGSNSTTPCVGLVYNGTGCYVYSAIVQQSNVPAGRGYQYNYWTTRNTAAQVLTYGYPSPTDTKATAPAMTTSSTTTSTSPTPVR